MLKTLAGFGLSCAESKLYFYIAKAGPCESRDLRRELKMTKQQLDTTIESLKKKGIVTEKSERATLFSALAFEELLNLFLKLEADKVKAIKKTKEELINSWRSMTKLNNS